MMVLASLSIERAASLYLKRKLCLLYFVNSSLRCSIIKCKEQSTHVMLKQLMMRALLLLLHE
jgi:hypothetical protein